MEKKINIIVVGRVPPSDIFAVQNMLGEVFRYRIDAYARIPYPEKCIVSSRNQYDAACILYELLKYPGFRVLGIIDKDIFIDGTNYIFGLAASNGKCALVSTYRLKNASKHLYLSRLRKEIMHELGHTFGLRHCKNHCVMHFSNTLFDVDQKPGAFCKECAEKIKTHLR